MNNKLFLYLIVLLFTVYGICQISNHQYKVGIASILL